MWCVYLMCCCGLWIRYCRMGKIISCNISLFRLKSVKYIFVVMMC